MEKQNNPQLELFSRSDDRAEFKANTTNPLLVRIWNYEKTILIIIAIFITGIIAFSLGVEKGKRIASKVQNEPLTTAKIQNVEPPVIIKKEEVVEQITPAIQQLKAFTIQVASFKTRSNAQKEAETLKKKGLSTLILTKGSYTILCVGNFPNKEAAQSLLSQLNKRYGNCQIRRL